MWDQGDQLVCERLILFVGGILVFDLVLGVRAELTYNGVREFTSSILYTHTDTR